MPSDFPKDPDAVLDYSVDWSSWLTGSETITASSWTVPDGITKDSDSFSDDATMVWLSGGTAKNKYSLINHITTSAGREEDRTITIHVGER